MPKVTRVGLDIGSSAVRAAEVATDDGSSQLLRFAQVGLPPGAVVEGEVRDGPAVTAALKRLWADGGFSKRDVVVGIASQRAMVRLLEMPNMAGAELRSALRYEISELLPIPIEQAVFDFAPLGPGEPKADGTPTMQVLAVVAQRNIVWDAINVVRKAGLRPRAVDSSPLAMLRALPQVSEAEMEAVVSVGAQLVVVAVRQASVPKFVRTVTLGAEDTSTVGGEVAVGASPGGSRFVSRGPSNSNPAARVATVAEEVRGSLEYFLSHGRGERLTVITLTGGAVNEDIRKRLSAAVGVPVQEGKVLPRYDAAELGLTREQVSDAEMRWATAVGLALWGIDANRSPSLLPTELKERAQLNQAVVAAGLGVVLVAGGLGVLSHSRSNEVSATKRQVVAQQAEQNSLDNQIIALRRKALPVEQIKSLDQLGSTLLSGDINWDKLYGQLKAAAPAGTSLTEMSFSSQAYTPGASPATTVPGTAAVLGSVTVNASAKGGPPAVAEFLRKAYKISGLAAPWVSTATQAGTGHSATWNFQLTANITSAALSTRGARLPGSQP